MADVDNRIVSIQFDNRAFEQNIAATLDSIAKLQQSLDFSNATRNVGALEQTMDSFDTGGMGGAIESIAEKFTILGAVGFSVIQDLTQQVLAFTRQTATDLLAPIISGGKSRATNIENAKFQFRGLGIDVEKAMASAKSAVLGTAFGLDEAAKAAAQFGASGLDAGQEMSTALRGIAGAAAMTNSSFTEIADIFTSMAGIGTLGNQDLNRFAVRGLNATAVLSKALNKTEAEVHEMAREGEISFKQFSKIMDNAFGEHATKANETYTGALSNMRAAMSRLGASFFGPQMEQQRNLFNALSPVIDKVNASLQPLIGAFLDIRGAGIANIIGLLKNLDLTNFTKAVPNVAQAVRNIHAAVSQILNIGKMVFRRVFPDDGISQILKFSEAILRFTEKFKMGEETLSRITVIFHGLWDTLAIGWEVIKTVGSLLGELFSTLFKAAGLGNGSILKFFEDFAVKITKLKIMLVNEGGMARGVERFFEIVRDFVEQIKDFAGEVQVRFADLIADVKAFGDAAREKFGEVVDKIQNFLGMVDKAKGSLGASSFGAMSESVGRVTERLGFMEAILKKLQEAWQWFGDHLSEIGNAFLAVRDKIVEVFGNIGSAIAETMSTGNFDEVFDVINTGLIGGILYLLHKFMNGGLAEIGSGFLEKMNGLFDELTGTLQSMQVKVKAEALLKIAYAVGILAASLLVLSLINSEALTKALLAMGAAFAMLVSSMTMLIAISGGGVKLTQLAVGMVALASAVALLSGATALLAQLSWEEMARGLVGVATLIGTVTLAMNFMPDKGAMIRAGVGVTAIAAGMVLLSVAVKAMSTMSWGEMAKGLVGVAAGLGVLTVAMNFMPNGAGMVAAGAGIVLVATGLNILAGAVKLFSMMSLTDIAVGLIGVGGSLLVISQVMGLMPLNLPLTGAGLVLVGIGLVAIGTAMKIFASIDFGEMLVGLTGMAASLLILAVATHAMQSTLAGSAAILVSAIALGFMAKVLKTLGEMEIGVLAVGLLGMAAALAVLGGMATLMMASIPALLGLGIALALVGAGFALFGIGAAAVMNAVKLLADTGSVAIDALIAVFKALADKLPMFAEGIARAIVAIVQRVIEALPGIIRGLGESLIVLLQTLAAAIPEMAKTFYVLIDELLHLLTESFPKFVAAGLTLLLQFLNGILDNIHEVVKVVSNIIITLLDALAYYLPQIVFAGLNLLTQFLRGIAENLGMVIDAVFDIITEFIKGIGAGTERVIEAGVKLIGDLIVGVGKAAGDLVDKATNTVITFAEELKDNYNQLIDAGFDLLLSFIEGMTAAIEKYAPKIRDAGFDLGMAILDGMTLGLAGNAKTVVNKALDVAGNAVDGFKNFLGVNSPSKVFIGIGENVMQGFAVGLGKSTAPVAAGVASANDVVGAMSRTLTGLAVSMAIIEHINPTITPVVDLSNVARSAEEINRMMTSGDIVADASFDKASAIAVATQNQNGSDSSDPAVPEVREIKFEQNNYSPKALSVSDIHRNTKSQISMAKEELGV